MKILSFTCLLICLLGSNVVFAEYEASSSSDKYGPFDYSNPLHRKQYLPIVEKYHFNSNTENLIKGVTGSVWEDLDYTIRIFPNHHRALYAISKLYRRNPNPAGSDGEKNTMYYFDRAENFAPNDGMVKLIKGIHLHKMGKLDSALKAYKVAQETLKDSPELHYNMGLLYFDKHQLNLAKQHAQKAYDQGFPLPGLKNKLIRAGVWNKK